MDKAERNRCIDEELERMKVLLDRGYISQTVADARVMRILSKYDSDEDGKPYLFLSPSPCAYLAFFLILISVHAGFFVGISLLMEYKYIYDD